MVHNIGRMKRYFAAENVPEQLLDDYIDVVEDEEREEVTGIVVKSFNNEQKYYNITVVEKMMKSCECPYFVQHRTTPYSTSTSYTIFPPPATSASNVVALVSSTDDDVDVDVDIENDVEEIQVILQAADFEEDICDFEDEQQESITLEAENNLKDVNILWNKHQEKKIFVSTDIIQKIEKLKRLLQQSKEENDSMNLPSNSNL